MNFNNHQELKSFLKSTPKPTYSFGGLSSQPILQNYIGKTKISIVKNDLTEEKVDAIVNAANSFLAHGGGVAGAICRKGGRIIQKQSDQIIDEKRRIQNGESVTTDAGSLPCKKVIHTVGPIWDDGYQNEKEELAQCMKTILREARLHHLKTLSIPAISSGIFGFPKNLCAQILLEQTQELLEQEYPNTFDEIRFCNFDNETVEVFAIEFQKSILKQDKNSQELEKESKKDGKADQNEQLKDKDSLEQLENLKASDDNKKEDAQKPKQNQEISSKDTNSSELGLNKKEDQNTHNETKNDNNQNEQKIKTDQQGKVEDQDANKLEQQEKSNIGDQKILEKAEDLSGKDQEQLEKNDLEHQKSEVKSDSQEKVEVLIGEDKEQVQKNHIDDQKTYIKDDIKTSDVKL